MQGMTGTSGRQRVPGGSLAHSRVALLPTPIAEAFGPAVKPRLARATAVERESRTLVALRDALLPKLISDRLQITSLLSGAPTRTQ
jgi:type I restriction enzyme S subunit